MPTNISWRTPEKTKTMALAIYGLQPLPTSGEYICLFMKPYTGLFQVLQYAPTEGLFHQSSKKDRSPNFITSANAFSADWKTAKKPASQMTDETVDSLRSRSRMGTRSRCAILSSEFWSTGAAYWADASQMKTPRDATSANLFATKPHLIDVVRGYTGW